MTALFGEILSGFIGLISGIFKKIAEFAPKAFSLLMWILAAIIILPCVFIAYEIYPKWAKWGEGL